MNSALSLRFSTQAQLDIRRITSELSDLQRQVASGSIANDLSGFGESSARLVNTQGAMLLAGARGSVVSQLESRFEVQAQALRQAAVSITNLSTAIGDAVSSNDGRNVGLEVQLAFNGVVSALNETWNGQPLFAGERVGNGPVSISSLEQLLASNSTSTIFDEAARHQTIDINGGSPIQLADKASEISVDAFQAIRDLQVLINQNGGQLGAPMSAGTIAALQGIADDLKASAATFNAAEGRAGQLTTRFSSERVRLQDRSNLLFKEVGSIADSDIAEVSVRISSLMVQYEASAKTFADLSKLSLLNYL